jgi:hypothetical protein
MDTVTNVETAERAVREIVQQYLQDQATLEEVREAERAYLMAKSASIRLVISPGSTTTWSSLASQNGAAAAVDG